MSSVLSTYVRYQTCSAEGGEKLKDLCSTDYIGLPNCAPAAQLVIGQPQNGQPSVTSPSDIRLCRCQTDIHSMPSQPTRCPAQVPVTNCLSQF